MCILYIYIYRYTDRLTLKVLNRVVPRMFVIEVRPAAAFATSDKYTNKQKQPCHGALVLVENTEALRQLFLALAGLVLLEQPHHHDQELLEVDGTATCVKKKGTIMDW